MPDEINYKELLRKYVLHVVYQEGIDFSNSAYQPIDGITEDEWLYIKKIQEIDN